MDQGINYLFLKKVSKIFLGKSFNLTSRKAENEKRRREAEALQARMEREKQELRAYIEKDNMGRFIYFF